MAIGNPQIYLDAFIFQHILYFQYILIVFLLCIVYREDQFENERQSNLNM